MSIIEEKETRDRLLKNVKKECKQLMEIAVTRKCINEDNSCITTLCATIEQCLLHGLKRRAVGLFKTSTTMSLLQKISKSCPEAEMIVKMCEEYEKAYCSSSNGSPSNPQLNSKSMSVSSNLSRTNIGNQSPSAPKSPLSATPDSAGASGISIFSRKIFSNASDSTLNATNQQLNGRSFSPTFYKGSNCYKFLWIRMALLNKLLIKIIDFIIANSAKFYIQYALVADPVDGPIFSSLLIGPCALEYTRVKTCDHIWSDPNADELIQRHRMHGNHLSFSSISSNPVLSGANIINSSSNTMSSHHQANPSSSPKFKLGLNASLIAKRKASMNALEDISNTDTSNSKASSLHHNLNTSKKENMANIIPPPLSPLPSPNLINSPGYHGANISPTGMISSSGNAGSSTSPAPTSTAKEYVESLHQNSKSQLIYGKNHVIVNQKETQFAGYLSLHSTINGLILKWTPNQIMNGSSLSFEELSQTLAKTKSGYWDYAMNIDINTIVYLHCHQQGSTGATIVLVAQDGVQHPPIRFPKGSHLLQFLTCLESGLAPNGQLDPPLSNESGKGKTFPKLHRKSIKRTNQTLNSPNTQNDKNESSEPVNTELNPIDDEQEDFVFRIINSKSNGSYADRSRTQNIIRSILPRRLTDDRNSSLGSIFSSFSANNPSINQTNSSTESLNSANNTPGFFRFSSQSNSSSTTSLNKKFSVPDQPPSTPSSLHKNSSIIDSGNNNNLYISTSISPSSLILDNNNSSILLNKLENLQASSNSGVDNDFVYTSRTGKGFKSLSVRSSLRNLCDNMRKQILSRAFYGWLAYHRHLKTVSIHLIGLVNCDKNNKLLENGDEIEDLEYYKDTEDENKIKSPSWYLRQNLKLDEFLWNKWIDSLESAKNGDKKLFSNKNFFYKIVYFNGIDHKLRKKIWPFLLEHYTLEMNQAERSDKDKETLENYLKLIEEWKPFEEYIHTKESKKPSLGNKTAEPSPNKLNSSIKSISEADAADMAKTEDETSANKKRNIFSFSSTKVADRATDKKPNLKTPPLSPSSSVAKTSSLFGFNLLKPKSTANKLKLINESIDETKVFEGKKEDQKDGALLRKDSSLSNEVFIDENSSKPSLLSRFSARMLFSKLMQKNIDDDSHSINSQSSANYLVLDETIKEDDEQKRSSSGDTNQDDEIDREVKNVARMLVNTVIARAQEQLTAGTPTECGTNSSTTMRRESTKSDSIYIEAKNALSNTASSYDVDDVYHDVDSEIYIDDLSVNMKSLLEEEKIPSSPVNAFDSCQTDHALIEKHVEANRPIRTPLRSFSSNQTLYKKTLSNLELIDMFALNMHRIDKDVTRCDRNYYYFMSNENLKKLKNIMYTYVWENINIGYIQGMCDLVAPLLVIFDDEPMAYSCFKQIMKRMSSNFPHGTAMDQHFSNMRTLIQILDSDLFEHMHHRGDYTHFYFSYRWFLLDFKRELVYDDVFSVWETIWAAKYVSSEHFFLFIALALVETYRDIIIENNMDFTDIIKFFNEMAEKHNTVEILALARNLIQQLQDLIDNKDD